MGKYLVIKGADFSNVAVEQVIPVPDAYASKTVQGSINGQSGEEISQTNRLRTDFFEVKGTSITLDTKSEDYPDSYIVQVVLYNSSKTVIDYQNWWDTGSGKTITITKVNNTSLAAGQFIRIVFHPNSNSAVLSPGDIYIDSLTSNGIEFTENNSFVI